MKRITVIILAVVAISYNCTSPKTKDACIENADTVIIIEKKNVGTYANDDEKAIIDNMNCWKITGDINYADTWKKITEGKVDKENLREIARQLYPGGRDPEFVLIEHIRLGTTDLVLKHAIEVDKVRAKFKGEETIRQKERLYNNTKFIGIVRNDSLYNALLDKRKKIAKSLSIYKNKVLFFRQFIDKIDKDIIEYNYYNEDKKGLGIYEHPIKGNNRQFYKNYSDLLKEEYKKNYENSNIKDEDIKNLNDILKSLEKLDRALWAVKYYKASKKELENENNTKQREEQIEKLFE